MHWVYGFCVAVLLDIQRLIGQRAGVLEFFELTNDRKDFNCAEFWLIQLGAQFKSASLEIVDQDSNNLSCDR